MRERDLKKKKTTKKTILDVWLCLWQIKARTMRPWEELEAAAPWKIRGACRPAGAIGDILAAAAARLSSARQSCQSPPRTPNAPLCARPRNTHTHMLAGKSLYMPRLNTRRCQFLTWRPHRLPSLSPPGWDERANVCSRRASKSRVHVMRHER